MDIKLFDGSGQQHESLEEEVDMGISCTLDMFKEYKEINHMISDIPNISGDSISVEISFEKFESILKQYQEQPHLLDPHLQNLLNSLIRIVMNSSLDRKCLTLAFQYLWKIVKVRGYKNVMKKMPHEVKDLIPVLKLLEREDIKADFHACYILLMWLAIIIYMPFSLSILDSSLNEKSSQAKPVVERVLDVIKCHLKCAQSSREMAAYVLSRLVTRPDLKDKYLRHFIDYGFEVIENSKPPELMFHKMGILRSFGLIFKHGKRMELVGFSCEVLFKVLNLKCKFDSEGPLKIFVVKLVQRIGLTFLRPKVALWRYQRGNRSLSSNMTTNVGSASSAANRDSAPSTSHLQNPEEEEEDDDDVPAEIEDVIDFLLKGLKDQDTVIRWSAAKGIGRICERLPQSLADCIVEEILGLFSLRESDKAWHGGCLALAELARRGLLLPSKLDDVMPILQQALVYDKLKGQFSIGSNIRDAACYLCWSFARAYHPSQMTPFVTKVATGLLIVALFDREIPCRRAGSAAFQENVGRQGNFPHGIEILTQVDYYAVGNRTNAYHNLSFHVAKYPEYTRALIDHLVDKKVGHWDSVIRELTAQTLHNFTSLDPIYNGHTILPKLLTESVSTVLISRHGAILACGAIIHALYLKSESEGKDIGCYVGKDTLEQIYDVVPSLSAKKLFKGMGGEFMRQAAAVFIEKCSLSRISLESRPELLDEWYNLLEDGVLNFEGNIREACLGGISALWVQYYQVNSEQNTRGDFVQNYIEAMKNCREMNCLGYTALLGHLPEHLLRGKLSAVLEALSSALKITPNTESWASTRKEAIKSIVSITSTVGIDPCGNGDRCMSSDNLQKVYFALLGALDDYTTDRRGDVGSWVREASMLAMQSLTVEVVKKDKSVFSPSLVSEMFTRICQQSVERIDRTRKVAGKCLETLLYCTPEIPHIPDANSLRKIFSPDWCSDCDWASERSNYAKFVLLLDFPVYRERVLLGLTYALGGMSAHLSRYTLEALQSYLNDRAHNQELLQGFVETIVRIFHQYPKDNRIILPLIKSLSDLLGSCTALDQILKEQENLLPSMLLCLKKECAQCNNYNKLAATATTLCELLRIQSPSTKTILTTLTVFLGYQYPKVRALTAASFLTALMEYSEQEIVPEDCLDEVTSILEDTPWMEGMDKARLQRNRICELLGIHVPQLKKKA